MKVLTWLIGVPVAVVAMIFAASNRGAVTVDLWPLPWMIDVPLFLLVLGALGLGLLFGAMVGWLSAGSARGAARAARREARKLEHDLKTLKNTTKQADSAAAVAAPVPPKALPSR